MKIAVAIDGSQNALRAAKHAITLAQHFPEAQLEIIYVADYNKAKDERLLAQNEDSLLLKRKKKIEPVLEWAQQAGVKVKTTMLKGTPSLEIIKYVNAQAVDQLVIGSRGLNTLQEMVLGSVSHKVMKHVKCPVTVVK
ncbi:universal stress protein [Sporosarcina sp. ACRSL]|uniref:universal stress protein n=1 Tax=Sporosarcina sp. ACRSL TaxID=2918215 RepID=UPI001EF5B911|nr:universal stress protein [Sporosarcina sp. ACRSL]MCG7346316.1 universal stress protein [Sporosarcina sp. ACRSL]